MGFPTETHKLSGTTSPHPSPLMNKNKCIEYFHYCLFISFFIVCSLTFLSFCPTIAILVIHIGRGLVTATVFRMGTDLHGLCLINRLVMTTIIFTL